MRRWQNVNKFRPYPETRVIAFGKPYGEKFDNVQYICTYRDSTFWCMGRMIDTTHWKHLEPNPKVK